MAVPADPLGRLQEALGHTFADPRLLQRALTHASLHDGARGRSNERLEFLGDRVLGLAVAQMLYRRHPGAEEGELARRLNALVRKEACADRALALGIDAALRLSPSEAQGGGRQKAAILADACEAVLGALHLDAGFPAAAAAVERVWAPLVDGAEAEGRDPKTALQERVQGKGGALPVYRLKERTGPDHKPHFVVVVEGEGWSATGEGGSKREAEQNAARAALEAHR